MLTYIKYFFPWITCGNWREKMNSNLLFYILEIKILSDCHKLLNYSAYNRNVLK